MNLLYERPTPDQAVKALEAALEALKADKRRTYWGRAINADAIELIENFLEECYFYHKWPQPDRLGFILQLMSGAESWKAYSWGGSALIYDEDIARHYCTPSELKRTDNGRLNPNKYEAWLDVQARALNQAGERAYWFFREELLKL